MVDLIVDPWKTGMFGRGIRQKRRFKSNKRGDVRSEVTRSLSTLMGAPG